MKKKYIILVEGCDDDTIIEKVYEHIVSISLKISQSQCMPRMYIKELEK
jgi:hypothetical protein